MASAVDPKTDELLRYVKHGQVEGLRRLLDRSFLCFKIRGANVNGRGKDGFTPLHLAHNREIAEVLIEKGADVLAMSDDGWTPLHLAVGHDRPDVVPLLLSLGADVNARTNAGATPLHCAGEARSHIAKLLLCAGGDVRLTDDKGKTPLHHWASDGSDENTAAAMVAAGADVNAKDNNDCTPLICALRKGRESNATWLLKHGVDVNCRAKSGEGALDIAIDRRLPQIEQLLLEKGARLRKVNQNVVETWGKLDIVGKIREVGSSELDNLKEAARSRSSEYLTETFNLAKYAQSRPERMAYMKFFLQRFDDDGCPPAKGAPWLNGAEFVLSQGGGNALFIADVNRLPQLRASIEKAIFGIRREMEELWWAQVEPEQQG